MMRNGGKHRPFLGVCAVITGAILCCLLCAKNASAEILTPPYFNLAEGRKMHASATCGEDIEGPELYCKLVGATSAENEVNPNLIHGQHCDFCDPTRNDKRHPPEFAVDGMETWWQSPPLSRGMKYNEVNLTMDLGQEFHVAYVYIRMGNSPRPGMWILEKSVDYGKTFVPWQYFAETPSDCAEFFGEESLAPISKDDSVICTTAFSHILPLEGGEMPISLLKNRPSSNHYFNSTVLQEWTRATNVRLRMLRTKNLFGHLMSVSRQDNTVTRRYFYSIKDISVGGRCMCNGHADSCDNRNPADPAILVCLCRHNTCGLKCDSCCPGFEQKAWRQSKSSAPFTCEPCNCFNHTNECIYDPEVDKRGESLDIHGKYEGGGVCQNCQHNTEGINCNRCKPKYYKPFRKHWNETDVCEPCDCDIFYSTGNCAEGTGKCECREEYQKPNCDSCSFGYYGYPTCKSCDCLLNGTLTLQCEARDGICDCKKNFGGDDCRKCADDYFDFPNCEPCECNPLGAVSSVCDKTSGNCTCKNNYGGKQCEECQAGYFSYPSCTLCTCDTKGTEASICDKETGRCICKEGYTGANCDQCDKNFFGYPECKSCNCSAIGSSSTTCGITGKCTCLPGFAGRTCEQCSPGYYMYPKCLSCDCDTHGANGASCNDEGICQCHYNYDGERCDRCMDGFYNFPACEECNCNPAGVIAAFAGCGFAPKGELCQCKDRVEGRICDKCKPLYWNLNAHNTAGCEECHCHIPGVLGGIAVCDSDHGQCTCKPNVVARGCTECDDGTYNLEEDNLFGCTDCGCDVGGAISPVCHKSSGQCACQPRITGKTCKEPIATHYFPTLYQYQYEAEDGRTQDSDVRYLYKDEDFPGYSWKGYAIFNILQTEILHDIIIYKPSLYRIVLRYITKSTKPVHGVVKVIPDSTSDQEQEHPVIFQNTGKPTFVTVSVGNTPAGYIMGNGKWTVSIKAGKGLFLDYFVILPEEFYMPLILKHKIVEPCHHDSQSLCRQFRYPSINKFAASFGSGAYIDLGENGISNPSSFYDDFGHLEKMNITTASRIPLLNHGQPELDYNITLKKPGKYVVLVTYITPLNSMNTYTVNVSVIGDNDVYHRDNDRIILYKCKYTTTCRQVVTDQDGVVGSYTADENLLHVKLRGPEANVGIHSVVAIPFEEWSVDYIQPRPTCIQKDGSCIKSTYTDQPESKKISFEKDAIYNEDQPKPIIKNRNGINYVYLNQSNNMIDVRSKVPNPGYYTFVLHYYQPDYPEYDLNVLVQNGFMYESKVSLPHCPKTYGCRSVVAQKDGTNKISLTENFMITLSLPTDKNVYLDYILVIPSDLYNLRITEEDDFDRTDEFIRTCGKNHFHINTSDEGFCRDSVFSITAGYNAGALRCKCDYAGTFSFDCQKFGGQCECKPNVIGRDCSICKTGYYEFPNCKPCNCPSGSTCDHTGQCICPPRVQGELCDQCEPFSFGFDEFNGCEECKCNPLGVTNTLQCDLYNGSCPCKPNVYGRKCDSCNAGHFGFPYCDFCECNLDGTTKDICDQQSAECFCKKQVSGPACDICAEGTYNLQASNENGCTDCFCFGKTNRCYASNFMYRTYTYAMEDWEIVTLNETLDMLNVTYLNISAAASNGQAVHLVIDEEDRDKTLYFSAPDEYLGKRLKAYGGFLNYTIYYSIGDTGKATLRPDVILVGPGSNNYLKYMGFEQPPVNTDFAESLEIVESNFVLPSGVPAKREHLMTILKDLTAIYIRTTYWSYTESVTLSDVSFDDADKDSSLFQAHRPMAYSVEICDCPPNYAGLSCEECAPGYYRISTGPHGGYCVPCNCNGHAQECDVNSGVCLNCQHNTVGDHCEQCEVGYHGNAKHGTPMDCLICACPIPMTGNNFAHSCDVSADGEHIHCSCNEGYRGARCQFCAAGYYGRPDNPGDYCKPCECSGNIDTNDLASCDTVTGECLLCLNNTAGEVCGLCAPGHFGDAIGAKDCQSCVCDLLGTAECIHNTGECVCKQNVVGDKCDRCEVDHYGFPHGAGCYPCACSEASLGTQCDESTGLCRCKPGVTGRTCDKCKAGYWNLTSEGCISCGCKGDFSIGVGCNSQTGQCECLPGVTGDKCDRCPHRWAFLKEYGCMQCDSCTDDLLDFTDYLATLIDPIQDEFNSVGSGFFTTRRLAHINDTINKLRPKVEQLSPDKVNMKPILDELDTMNNEANNMNRQANYSLNNSKNLVKSADELRGLTMLMVDKVQDASDEVDNTIDNINNLSTNLLENDSPRLDTARRQAEEYLDHIVSQNMDDRESDALDSLNTVQNLMDNMAEFKEPIDEFNDKIINTKRDLKEFNAKLDDLANHTQISLERSQEAKSLYDKNGKDRLERKLQNINTQTQESQKNINDSIVLNKNATHLLEDAHRNYEDITDFSYKFNDMIKDFDLHLESVEDDIDRFEPKIPQIQKHSDELLRNANELAKILNETLLDSENAVKAATAYNVIKNTINEAEDVASSSKATALDTSALFNNLQDTIDKSDSNAVELLLSADEELHKINNLEPTLKQAVANLSDLQNQYNKDKDILDNLDRITKNNQTKNLDDILLGAKENAERAEKNIEETVDELERGFKDIEYKLLDSKDLSPKVYATNQAILQMQNELKQINQTLPKIIESLNSLPQKRRQEEVNDNLKNKMNKLTEQIALARDLANRIDVGLKFSPRTILELRNPNNIEDLSTSTQISGYFKTPNRDGLLLFLGNGNGTNVGRSKTDDYMALQIVNGYPTLTMDLGNGAQQIVNDKYVADNRWYQFIIDRTGLNAKLTIKEELPDSTEREHTKEIQLDGPLSIFNLDRNQSKLIVGSHPVDFVPPLNIHRNSFEGEVEGLVVGDTPISMWNFNRGYENNHGAQQRDALFTTKATGYRFNGNGYTVLNSRALPFRQNSDIKLDFKTFANEGLLLLYGNEDTFLSLELRNGKILYKYNLGQGTKVFHTPSTYNDGNWHTVNAVREGPAGLLYVDGMEIPDRSTNITGNAIEYQETFFVGGYPQMHSIKDVTNIDFDGCIDNLVIMGKYIDLKTNIKAYGVIPGCPVKFTRLVSFYPGRAGYVKKDNISSANDIIANLKFKTKEKYGLIFFVTDRAQDSGMSLSLDDGHLKLISQKTTLITRDNTFNDNEWHVVSVRHNNQLLRLDFDDIGNAVTDSPPPPLHILYGDIFIGGVRRPSVIKEGMIPNYAPFAGCIADATVNGNIINFANSTDKYGEELGKCILDKQVGSDSDIHVVPTLPPLQELGNVNRDDAEEHTEYNFVKNDIPKRGDGGKDDGAKDIQEEKDDQEDKDELGGIIEEDIDVDITNIETTTWPTPRPHPTITTTIPPICALPLEPQIDVDALRYGAYSFGDKKGSRLEYNIARGKVRKAFSFSLEFKTLNKNGIIFYVSDPSHKQFATLYLQDGYVHFKFQSMNKVASARSMLLYADNIWHKATFSRDYGSGQLQVDDDIIHTEANQNITKLDVSHPYYVGGVPEEIYNHNFFPHKTIDQFQGCIRKFQMNEKPMENPTEYKVLPCSDNMEPGIFFTSKGGYVRLKERFKVGLEIEVKMDIKPRSLNGLIMAVHGKRDYFVLELENGALKLTVDNGLGPITTKFIPSTPHQFCDGQWHSIQAVKSKSVVTLAVNGVYSDPGIGDNKSASTDTIGYLFLGGHRMIQKAKGITVRTPFAGCIRSVIVNGVEIRVVQSMVEGGVQIGSCPTN